MRTGIRTRRRQISLRVDRRVRQKEAGRGRKKQKESEQ